MNLIILGLDPSTVSTGYGLIHVTENNIKCLDYGVICSKENSFLERLYTIHKGIQNLCKIHKPDHLAVEKVFFGKNPDTAFKLGHIFALCLIESKRQNIEFFEYASRFVKKNVTFSGKSSKDLVQSFVTNFFSLPKTSPLDATDALAVALCHSREYKKQFFHKQLDAASL